MKSHLLDFIPEQRRYVKQTIEDGVAYVETRQDAEPIIQAAKVMFDDNPPKDMRRVALIPHETLNKALLDGWFHDPAAWKKWANDPANECFRTTKGTI